MDPAELVKTRCKQGGLEATSKRDPRATVRETPGSEAKTRSNETLASPTSAPERGLPKISVELRGTLGGPADPPSSPAAPRDLEVLETLGEGGMGRVFAARQHSLDRDVAIKTVRDQATDAQRAALLTEGAIMGSLEHPAIIPVHALGVDEAGRPVLVMKRVEHAVEWTALLDDPAHAAWEGRGGSADDRLEGHLEILMQVANAAHFAHSRGVVHRDIKPQNVLLGRYGEVYLADWGIGVRVDKGAPAGPLTGTPAYMAPEMVLGEAIDARTDVYLLGGALHRVLTGAPRHVAKDLGGTLLGAALSEPFAYASDVPRELAALANRATAKDPGARPHSAETFRAELADFLKHRSSVALARSAEQRLERLRAVASSRAGLDDLDAQRSVELSAAEARFALKQALEEWADNEPAKAALGELEELLAARRARAAELERFARDNDIGVASRERGLALAGIMLVGVALSISAVVKPENPTPTVLFYQSLGPDAALAVAAFLLRRRLRATPISKRVMLGLAMILGSVTLSRAFALATGLDAAAMLVRDCLLLGCMSALAALVAPLGSMALSSVALLAAGAGAALWPAHAFFCFSLGTGFALVTCAMAAYRERASGPDRASP